ncbi:hypothetical protein [Kutzneria sp. NPDC052558]|uniref:hypothetical protein n=1 Tax=Kutzneria sp. NPDC052558 TaxID=3364121 RepID=UPI0037CB1A1C
MTSGRPEPPGEDPRRLTRSTDNDMSGEVHGALFQTGDVAGGIHNHIHYHGAALTPPGQQSAPATPPPLSYQPPATPPLGMSSPVTPAAAAAIPYALPAKPRRRWLARFARWCGEWLLSLAPIFGLSILPGFLAFAIAGDDSVGARLAGLVVGVVVLGAIGSVWWLVTRSRSQLSLGMFVLWALDGLAFRRLATIGRAALICLTVVGWGAVIVSVADQPQPSASGGAQHPAVATVFYLLLALVVVRRLRQR